MFCLRRCWPPPVLQLLGRQLRQLLVDAAQLGEEQAAAQRQELLRLADPRYPRDSMDE